MKICMFSLYFLTFSFSLFAQDTIKFELTPSNNMSIECILNEGDSLKLMLHTAASGISLTEKATQNLNSIKWNAADSTKSWGGSSISKRSNINQLQIGNLVVDSVMLWEDLHSGPGTDGKFGLDLFGNKIVEINNEAQIIVLHDSMPLQKSSFQDFEITYQRGMFFLEGAIEVNDKSYINKFLIHSGYSGSLLFDDEFAKNTQLNDHLEITEEQELKDSYGNVLKTKKAILPIFKLGKISLNDLNVGFFDGAIGRQKMSVLGGDVIKRFNLFIDQEKQKIYLELIG